MKLRLLLLSLLACLTGFSNSLLACCNMPEKEIEARLIAFINSGDISSKDELKNIDDQIGFLLAQDIAQSLSFGEVSDLFFLDRDLKPVHLDQDSALRAIFVLSKINARLYVDKNSATRADGVLHRVAKHFDLEQKSEQILYGACLESARENLKSIRSQLDGFAKFPATDSNYQARVYAADLGNALLALTSNGAPRDEREVSVLRAVCRHNMDVSSGLFDPKLAEQTDEAIFKNPIGDLNQR